MTPLPTPLLAPGNAVVVVGWRVDAAMHALTWDSGVGAERLGGRWNPVGVAAVYTSLDPSTCILEVAVHKGFRVLDTQPHVLTSLEIEDPTHVKVIQPEEIPNPAWLHGSIPSAGQQEFGAALLAKHVFVVLPSAPSKNSWNMVFNPARATGRYKKRSQERLVIDTRLNPATKI